MSVSRAKYLDFPPTPVHAEPGAFETVRHGVTLDPLVGVIAALSSDPFETGQSSQVDLQPLLAVVHPGQPRAAWVLEPGRPRAVMLIVHCTGGEHGLADSAVLDTQRNVAGIWAFKRIRYLKSCV